MSATEGAGHIAMSLCLCTRRTQSTHARALAGLAVLCARFLGTMVRNAYRKKAACMNLSRRAPNASRPECASTQVRISGVFSMRQNATHLRQALRSLRVVFGLAARQRKVFSGLGRTKHVSGMTTVLR